MVALSGGVDSSASLALLKEEMATRGEIARLEAAYIKTWMHEEDPIGECPWREDIADATAVCEKLGVPFRVVNLVGEYEKHVVRMLVDGYARGITPNPDIACNRFIKFGAFLRYAIGEGFTHLATGHYARVEENMGTRQKAHPNPSLGEGLNNMGALAPIPPAGDTGKREGVGGVRSYSLLEGVDPNKDQSYFLAQLDQEQLSRAIFPVGGLLKPEVREIARKHGLRNSQKKDSQGICFLGKVRINDFLRRYLPDSPGPIVDNGGRVLGEHRGLHHYTLGQRKGIGIPSNHDYEHYVVIAKDFSANTLRVAFDHPATPELYQRELRLHHIHWVNPKSSFEGEGRVLARPRYRDPKVESTLNMAGQEGSIIFDVRQRALASGQLVAFHNGDELIGSGIYL